MHRSRAWTSLAGCSRSRFAFASGLTVKVLRHYDESRLVEHRDRVAASTEDKRRLLAELDRFITREEELVPIDDMESKFARCRSYGSRPHPSQSQEGYQIFPSSAYSASRGSAMSSSAAADIASAETAASKASSLAPASRRKAGVIGRSAT